MVRFEMFVICIWSVCYLLFIIYYFSFLNTINYQQRTNASTTTTKKKGKPLEQHILSLKSVEERCTSTLSNARDLDKYKDPIDVIQINHNLKSLKQVAVIYFFFSCVDTSFL